MRATIGLSLFAVLTALAAPSAAAQRYGLREVAPEASDRWSVALVVVSPQGEFRQNAQAAAGATLSGTFHVARSGWLGLRVEGSYLFYGSSYGYGQSSTSSLAGLELGPQITLGGDAFALYGFVTMGGGVAWTSTSADCGCSSTGSLDLASFVRSSTAGAGFTIGVSHRRPVSLDLGIREQVTTRARIVPDGGVIQNPDGTYTVQTVRSPLDNFGVRLGLSFGIR